MVRRVVPQWRPLLWIFLALTMLSTVMLYVGADTTDRFFSWTVLPPMSAAFLGAGYAAGFLLTLLTTRESVWANARIALLTVLLFVWLTAIATMMHLDRFHFDHENVLPRFAAGLWVLVYVAVPVWMAVLTVAQLGAPGSDPPRAKPVPVAIRAILVVQGVVMAAAGVTLMVAPGWVAEWWPWEVAPLAGRATGAWLIALGFAALQAALVERDFIRLRAASWTYAAFAVLQIAAMVRFSGQVRWDVPATWGWLVLLASIAAFGVYGGIAARRSPPDGSPADAAGRVEAVERA